MSNASLIRATMRRLPLPFLAAALGLAGAAPAITATPTPTPLPLQPTSKWNVDFGDAHCIAMRNYGPEAAPLLLAFKPSPIGEVMQVSIVRPGTKWNVDQYPGWMTVGTAKRVGISVLGYPAKASKSRVSSINLSPELYRPLRTASVVRLQSPGEMDYSFSLANLDAVARTLDQCVAGLRAAWNIENETGAIKQMAVAKKPPAALFSWHDYPNVALRAGDTGLVALVVLVDEAGKVASCQVTQSSGVASLDAQSCAVITDRARFNPALGVGGKPVKTGTTLRIQWKVGS